MIKVITYGTYDLLHEGHIHVYWKGQKLWEITSLWGDLR